jgi:hypothetical protein
MLLVISHRIRAILNRSGFVMVDARYAGVCYSLLFLVFGI